MSNPLLNNPALEFFRIKTIPYMELWIKGMTPVWHPWLTPTSITKAWMYPVPITAASPGLMTHLTLLRALLPMPHGQEHPGKVSLLESKANINLKCVTQATMTMVCTKLRIFSNSSLKLCNKSSGEMRLSHKFFPYIGRFPCQVTLVN